MSNRIEEFMRKILPKTAQKTEAAKRETLKQIELSKKSREESERAVFDAYDKVGIALNGAHRR